MKNLLLIAALAFLCGCQSFQTSGGKLLASTELTVDAAMQGWAAWVASGRATAGDEQKVKVAYQEYQIAMQIASAAYVAAAKANNSTAFDATSATLQSNANKLTTLITLIESKGIQ